MKRFFKYFFLLCHFLNPNLYKAQLNNIKIILPKEIGFSYYDFVQFLPDEKHFVVCANSIAVYNTETSEVIDEVELGYGARNLSISEDGKYFTVSLNNELFIFSFINQKLELAFKTNTSELIKDIPNSVYYGSLPISGCFFTKKPNELFISIGAFTLLYNFQEKKPIAHHAFELSNYLIHSVPYKKENAAILAVASGTNSCLIKQNLSALTSTTQILMNMGNVTKLKIKDSLLFCFTADKYFIMNLTNGNIVHEVRVPKIKQSTVFKYDQKFINELNKRPALSVPDTLNFGADDYVYDIDFLSNNGQAVYATTKGLKFIDLKTKKLKNYASGFFMNLKVSQIGNRMICNSFSSVRSLRIYEPEKMKLIAEKSSMSNSIYSSNMSPNNRWLITYGGTSAYLWDLTNFSKYAEIKDVSGKDTSFVNGAFFLNDSNIVINSGTSIDKLNLAIYNIQKKKFTKILKKGVFAFTSGFLNNEFYYCDYTSIHIVNLKTLVEEKYEGTFSLAASNMYKVINFTDNLVFIPGSGKFKIQNRKTKQTVYETTSWSVNANIIFSNDEKYIYTTSQINKKKNFNGTEIEIPTNAVVKIDLEKKQIANDYAETNFPYDFILKNNGKILCVWYVKYDIQNYKAEENIVTYAEYETESANVLLEKALATTSLIIPSHFTSETGKYFALDNMTGSFLKVYDSNGKELIDLSNLKYTTPKLYFNESVNRLIVTSPLNSLATFVDLEKRKIIGQLANAYGDQYFLITSNLHYMGSKEFVKNIRFKHESEIFSFEQFDAQLNQPHQVLRAFGCSDSSLIKGYETAYLKRMKVLGLKGTESLTFNNLPSFQNVIMNDDLNNKVKFSVSINKGKNPLTLLEVHNNGSIIHTQNIPQGSANKFDVNLSFETTSGINRFEFIAKDNQGIESKRITRFYNNTNSVKPNLYLVVIASEKFKNNKYDLSYAVKDASDMANTMSNSKSFNKIIVKKMFDQSFSPDSVSQLQSFFSQSGINDVAMVFFAGHGYLDEDFSYYFPTYYTDFTDPKINSVPYNSFETLFKNMKPIKKLMFIDACFSGEVDEEGTLENNSGDTTRSTRSTISTFAQSTALEMAKTIFSDLRQNSGATIISSAGGTEAAFEGEKWNNGLFTHCVLEAFKELKADLNKDKKITLSELQKHVSDEVYKLSEGKQSPTYRTENTVLDYELW